MIRATIVASLLAALLPSTACTLLDPLPPERTSVEAVLRATDAIGALLDREEKEALKSRERTVTSLPPLVFQRPLEKLVFSSGFGSRAGRPHTGIDLRAPEGTPIVAVLDGYVVFAADAISGYGLTVILRHARGYATLYAHCSELLVEEGARVEAGQRLALVGATGNASGPHLHFELREGLLAVDPKPLLFPPAQSRK